MRRQELSIYAKARELSKYLPEHNYEKCKNEWCPAKVAEAEIRYHFGLCTLCWRDFLQGIPG